MSWLLLIVPLPLVAAALALDVHGRRAAPRGEYTAIVVAGCGVLADGTASPALRRRTEMAVRLYREGRSDRIVLTGGVGTHPPSEAQAAAVVCRSLGVPGEALVLEEVSTTTEENARFAAALVGPGRVLVVTDCYHVFRCARTFAHYFGAADAVGAAPPPVQRARMALREVGAVLGYACRGWLRAGQTIST